MPRLSREFYTRPTLAVARDLLGCLLCHRVADGRVLAGRIVEVEAYDGPQDRASHAFRGPTPRNAPMFGRGGHAYVYLIYGMHHCLNVVTGEEGYPAAVLLRATEPPEGADANVSASVSASGPGRLTRAFGVDRSHDGADLTRGGLWIAAGDPVPRRAIKRTPRRGVDYAGAWAARKYRFVIAGHSDASGPKSLR